jgi:hypothetical protein
MAIGLVYEKFRTRIRETPAAKAGLIIRVSGTTKAVP